MIGVICKDAGGAEIISSYIRNNKINAIFCLENPAINIDTPAKINNSDYLKLKSPVIDDMGSESIIQSSNSI